LRHDINVIPTLADSETTTVKTVATSNVRELVLPAARTYFVVDPIAGNVKGAFDPSLGLRDAQAVRPVLVVVEQDSGKVIAAIDSEGRTIDVGSIPAFDSLVTGIDTRRAELSLKLILFIVFGSYRHIFYIHRHKRASRYHF